MSLAVSASLIAPRAGLAVARGDARARRAPALRVRASSTEGDASSSSSSSSSSSRRAFVAIPAAAAVATTLAMTAATTPLPATARGLPELECPGELVTAPSGLQFCDASVGAGREPTKGTLIKAHYTGRLADGTGRVFDSSYTRGSPLQFKIGAGQVIRGWDEGILGGDGVPPMKVGGKRVLVIPAKVRSVHWSPYDRVRVVNADP
jgi:peptidylprolyl isomerase